MLINIRALKLALPLAAAALFCNHAAAAGAWFAVTGDALESDVDTVELNLDSVNTRGNIKVMELRVSLAKQRTMRSGEKYTSYLSNVAINCDKSEIVHIEQTRYVLDKWQGAATHENFPEIRPMAFGGLVPNPKPIILRAACSATR